MLDCILPICDQKRCYLFVAIISSKDFFIMHDVIWILNLREFLYRSYLVRNSWLVLRVCIQRHEYKGLRIHMDDNKVIWKISVQLLALSGSVSQLCVVFGLLRMSRRLGAYMHGSKKKFPGGRVGWGLRNNCVFWGRGVRVHSPPT